MAVISEIKTRDWQLSLEKQGEIVTNIADINQCILVILTTEKGSDPLRPEFGSGIFTYIDKPVNISVPNIYREIVESVELWETRVKLETITHEINGSTLRFFVTWTDIRSQLTSQTILEYER